MNWGEGCRRKSRLLRQLRSVRFTAAERALLRALGAGATLKIHRSMDGAKEHRLHPLQGDPATIDPRLVQSLVRRGLLVSNLKFPAATYLLTEEGVRRAVEAIVPPAETC